MAVKFPSCFKQNIITEEITSLLRTPADCYTEVQNPYKFQATLSPTINFRVLEVQSPHLSSELTQKDFPVFSVGTESLVQLSVQIFRDSSFNKASLVSLFDVISSNYYSFVPFHNYWHGFSVMQMVFVIGERNFKFKDYLNIEEYYILLLAASAHDICHPGFGNSYLKATNHELSDKYSGISILENHHGAVFTQILAFTDIFQDLDFNIVKKIAIESILYTDMARHKQCYDDFNDVIENYDISNSTHRQKFINYILHCCDIGNQALEFNLAAVWTLKIIQEFNQQVAFEEKAGVQVSEFMRIGKDIIRIKNSQVGFISIVIFPVWKSLALHIKNLQDFPDTIEKNKKKWQEIENFNIN